MADILLHAALVIAAAFTGAAIYVSFVEHPARMGLSPNAALAEWQPAYKRGAAMQGALAMLGFFLAAGAAALEPDPLTVAGAAFMIAPWPWTLLVIMKLNNEMLAMDPDNAPADIHLKLARWNRLHAVRTVLGLAATGCLACAAL